MQAITPERLFTAQQFKVLRDKARADAMGSVRGVTDANLITRPLLPTDLYGVETAEFSNTTAIAAAATPTPQGGIPRVPQATAYLQKLSDGAAAAGTDAIVELWLGNGAELFAQIRLTPLWNEGDSPPVGFFDPVYWPTQHRVQIILVSNAAVAQFAEVMDIYGIVAETPVNVVTQGPVAKHQQATTVAG